MHKIVFTWFGNLPMSMELQRFYYYQRKKQSAAVQYFSLSRTMTIQNPNHQKTVLYPAHRIHNKPQKIFH